MMGHDGAGWGWVGLGCATGAGNAGLQSLGLSTGVGERWVAMEIATGVEDSKAKLHHLRNLARGIMRGVQVWPPVR